MKHVTGRRVRGFATGFAIGLALSIAAVAGFALTGNGTAASTVKPSNTEPPKLTGTPEEGKTLTATNGEWNGTTPIKFTYRFLRCNKDGANCYAGGTTTQKTYTPDQRDVGNSIRVRVIATNADGTTTATSAPTAAIREATTPTTPSANGCPSGSGPVTVSQLSAPARLTLDSQDVSPSIIGSSTQQITARFHVSACQGRSVQGALVYVTAVPFQQFSIPAETATGSDGWATLQMTRMSKFPASNNQQLLVMFARARKPGENELGGISTRRLVSFRVNLNR
jgi:hypothetical protein